MGKYRDLEKRKAYVREWARRFRAKETSEAKATRLTKRQKKRAQRPGYRTRAEITASLSAATRRCTACGETFANTHEFFALLHVKGREYLSAECRMCRKKRFRDHYDADRAKHVARVIAYVKSTPAAKAAKSERDAMRYMRRKKLGCPPWANHDLIQTLYWIADQLTKAGHPHEVDHHWPLMHKKCCGLHVPWNLRVVPTALNQAKGNRLPYDTGVVRDCTALL
jgi:hypothetical protein